MVPYLLIRGVCIVDDWGQCATTAPTGSAPLRGQRLSYGVGFDGRGAAARGRLWLTFTFKTCPENGVDSLLCVGCGMDDQAVIVLELRNPVLDVCGGIAVGVLVGDTGDGAKKS